MDRDDGHWQARLPAGMLEHVVWPVRMESHHDPDVPADKWRGYDALGLPCYYRHRFAQWDAALDGDDCPVVVLLRTVHFEAWRCLGGDWVRRVQRIDGDGQGDGLLCDSGLAVVGPQAVPRV